MFSESKQDVTSKNKMPIYPLSAVQTEQMPVFSVNSTMTCHLKVYPVKED